MTANEFEFLGGWEGHDRNTLKLVVMVAQHGEYTKNH